MAPAGSAPDDSAGDDMEGSAAGPRWLDEQEMAAWLALSILMMRLPSALDAQLQADAGLSHYEYLVLAKLADAPERTRRMSELATFSNGSPSRLSHVANRLERQGWLTRQPDPADGRSTLATLTDAGWQKVQASAPGHVEAVRARVFDVLTRTQVRQLEQICRRVHTAMDEVGPPGRWAAAG